ncbi:tyrosine-type recombinase/integrase [Herbaspirillum aquaticum]|uniref:tyrosine-type recombinase/integrase n=1 Tax=Herbaspirillum aquaticum TaxID=568783 RepID=UPI0024DE8DAF|nr:site-specific integrase [Herbaspirillum aquaticum]
MKRQSEKLEPVQLKNWYRAVQTGNAPVETDKVTLKLRQLKLPLARSDGDGLTFTLSLKGTASWILRYRSGGVRRELTLGNYPDIGLADARKLAREKRVEVDGGGDPATEKRRAKALALSTWRIDDLIKDYKDKILVNLGVSTQRSYGRNLTRIKTKLGPRSVTNVGPLDIVSMIESFDVGWSERNMLLITVRMLFRHAMGKKLIPLNPCVGIELAALIGKRPPVRLRLMLSENELKGLLKAEMAPENLLAIKVLLATAVRSDELRNAKWAHVDLKNNIWVIPSTKTGAATEIPIVPQVKALFLKLKSIAGRSEYVVPARVEARKSRLGGDAPINPNTLGAALDYWFEYHKPETRRFTPHDLRSTAKSYLRRLGVPRDITEMCLNHKLPGVEGIYDRHTYFEERKGAFTLWCNFLASLDPGFA